QASDRAQLANPDVLSAHALLPQSRHLFVPPAFDIGADDGPGLLRVLRPLIRKQEPVFSLSPRHDDQPVGSFDVRKSYRNIGKRQRERPLSMRLLVDVTNVDGVGLPQSFRELCNILDARVRLITYDDVPVPLHPDDMLPPDLTHEPKVLVV